MIIEWCRPHFGEPGDLSFFYIALEEPGSTGDKWGTPFPYAREISCMGMPQAMLMVRETPSLLTRGAVEPRVGLLRKTKTGEGGKGFWWVLEGEKRKGRKRKEEEGGVADHQVRRPWAWTASAWMFCFILYWFLSIVCYLFDWTCLFAYDALFFFYPCGYSCSSFCKWWYPSLGLGLTFNSYFEAIPFVPPVLISFNIPEMWFFLFKDFLGPDFPILFLSTFTPPVYLFTYNWLWSIMVYVSSLEELRVWTVVTKIFTPNNILRNTLSSWLISGKDRLIKCFALAEMHEAAITPHQKAVVS